jgi:hypothetical protein
MFKHIKFVVCEVLTLLVVTFRMKRNLRYFHECLVDSWSRQCCSCKCSVRFHPEVQDESLKGHKFRPIKKGWNWMRGREESCSKSRQRKKLHSRVARWFVFQTKNPNWGTFCRAQDWKVFTYLMAVLDILWWFGIFYDHLVHFVFI